MKHRHAWLGAMSVRPTGKSDPHNEASPAEHFVNRLEETFLPWLERTTSAMLPLLHPSPPISFKVLPITALPRPLYRLEKVTPTATVSVSTSAGHATTDKKQVGDCLEDGDDVLEPGWVWTKLKRNKRVTTEGWFQDVREIHLELEQPLECVVVCHFLEVVESLTIPWLRYAPGSISSLKPQTSEEEIQTFLSLNGLEDTADQPFVIQSLDTGKLSMCRKTRYLERCLPFLTLRSASPAASTPEKADHTSTHTARPRRCPTAAAEIVLRVDGPLYTK